MSQSLVSPTRTASVAPATARIAPVLLAALVGAFTGLGLVSVITTAPGPQHALIAAIVGATYAMGGAVIGHIALPRG